MWAKSRIGSALSWFRTRLASSLLLRSRKASFLVIGCLVLFLIWTASKLYTYRKHYGKQSENRGSYSAVPLDDVCLANHLAKWDKELDHNDVIISHNPLHSHESPYIPFVGNGHLGVAVRKDSFLQLKETTLMEVPYKPLIEPVVTHGPIPKEATVINIRDGVVHHVQSYLWAISAEVKFKEKDVKGWAQSITKEDSLSFKSNQVQYEIHQGNVAYLDKTHPGVNVSIATKKPPSKIHVKAGSTWEHDHIVVVHSSINLSKSPHNVVELKELEKNSKKDFGQVLETDPTKLDAVHKTVWNELWKTGLHVNSHHDPDTPPGNEVNATMYYILSTFPSPDYDIKGKAKDVDEFEALLHAPEHCFGGPPTMHSASLWPIPRTEAAVSRMMLSWKQVLTQNGCSSLIKAGATGIAQAMTLSFGGLQFSAGLFEFAANPASLHTSVTFRHIHLYKDVYINVSVVINEHTGHAEKLFLSANLGDGKKLFACEAGCQYEPVELGMSRIVFPVHMTKPVTPILYISKSKSQLQNIKKNVFIKDAHQG